MIPLQISDPLRWFLNGEWQKLLFEPVAGALGEQVFALFVVGMVVLPIYIRTGAIATPAVLLAVFAGVMAPALPGMLSGILYGVLWMATTVAIVGMITAIARRR